MSQPGATGSVGTFQDVAEKHKNDRAARPSTSSCGLRSGHHILVGCGGVANSRPSGVSLSRAQPRGTPDQFGLLGMFPALELVLALPCRGAGEVFFGPKKLHGPAPGRPICALALIVFLQTALRLVRHANVIGAVGTFQDVAEKHNNDRAARPSTSPCGLRSGHHILVGCGGGGGS